NPARLRLVTSFGLALLAGFGADAVLDGGPPARRWFLGLAAAVVVAGVLLAAAGNLVLPLLVPRLAAWGRHVVEARHAALPAPTHSLDYFYAELDEVLAGMARAFRIGNLAMYAPAAIAVGGWLAVRGSARGPMLVGSADSPLLRVLNLKYIVTTDELCRLTLAELAHVQPRSFVVHEAVVAESEAHALELLRSAPDAVYSRVVISGPADVPPVVGDGDGEATPIAYAPTETAWNVVTGAGGYLVNT